MVTVVVTVDVAVLAGVTMDVAVIVEVAVVVFVLVCFVVVVDAGNVVAVGTLPLHEQTDEKRVPVQSDA